MDQSTRAADDVRMRGFVKRHTVAEALAWLDAQVTPLGPEAVPLDAAADRVLAEAVVSGVDVPGFDRATMDGYAVVAASTEGAGVYAPMPLTIVGDALPGRPFDGMVRAGDAVRVMTGAPMPLGADAVLPAEYADAHGERQVTALTALSPWKHVGRTGEDVRRGTTVLEPGRRLRPQDVGVLSSIGCAQVAVVRRPRVRIVVTGNELLPAGSTPRGCQIADANGPMLCALVKRDGGVAVFPGLVRDDREAILECLLADADLVIVSGGSSVGVEDHAPTLVAEQGELAIHGIAMRPSSPTGLGRIGGRPVCLLPGNPVSSLCAYDFFAGRAIRMLGGREAAWPYASVRAALNRKISSPVGRLDYARVRLLNGGVEPLAVGGASVLSSTTRADGFVVVPEDSEGFPEGAAVDVWLYA